MTLLTLMDKLVNALENKEIVVGIFLEFSKAFDIVDHDILLQKLYHYGIRGCAYPWLESYLTHRTQFATYNAKSKKLKTWNQMWCSTRLNTWNIVVPYIYMYIYIYIYIYINDLHTVCKHTLPILFVDDTNFYELRLSYG